MKPKEGKLYRYIRLKAADVKPGDFLFFEEGERFQSVKKVLVDTEDRPMVRIYVTDDPIFKWLDTNVSVLQPIRVFPPQKEEPDEPRKESNEDPDERGNPQPPEG